MSACLLCCAIFSIIYLIYDSGWTFIVIYVQLCEYRNWLNLAFTAGNVIFLCFIRQVFRAVDLGLVRLYNEVCSNVDAPRGKNHSNACRTTHIGSQYQLTHMLATGQRLWFTLNDYFFNSVFTATSFHQYRLLTHPSVVIKDLRFEDKNKDLRLEDKDPRTR